MNFLPLPADYDNVHTIPDHVLAEKLSFQKEVGFGNWGSVWRCLPRDPHTKNPDDTAGALAVKLVHRTESKHSVARAKSLWNEMKIINNLIDDSHASIVKFYSFIYTPSYVLITMEYLPSMIPVEVEESRAIKWFAALLSAVAFLHSRGIVHNDIKVANILLNTRKTPVLVDYGFAEKYDVHSTPHSFNSNLTYGTPEYISPERAKGLSHDPRLSDSWSIGITFFEILTGRTPFEEKTDPKLTTAQDLEKYWQRTSRGVWLGSWTMSSKTEKMLKGLLNPKPEKRLKVSSALDLLGIDTLEKGDISNDTSAKSKVLERDAWASLKDSRRPGRSSTSQNTRNIASYSNRYKNAKFRRRSVDQSINMRKISKGAKENANLLSVPSPKTNPNTRNGLSKMLPSPREEDENPVLDISPGAKVWPRERERQRVFQYVSNNTENTPNDYNDNHISVTYSHLLRNLGIDENGVSASSTDVASANSDMSTLNLYKPIALEDKKNFATTAPMKASPRDSSLGYKPENDKRVLRKFWKKKKAQTTIKQAVVIFDERNVETGDFAASIFTSLGIDTDRPEVADSYNASSHDLPNHKGPELIASEIEKSSLKVNSDKPLPPITSATPAASPIIINALLESSLLDAKPLPEHPRVKSMPPGVNMDQIFTSPNLLSPNDASEKISDSTHVGIAKRLSSLLDRSMFAAPKELPKQVAVTTQGNQSVTNLSSTVANKVPFLKRTNRSTPDLRVARTFETSEIPPAPPKVVVWQESGDGPSSMSFKSLIWSNESSPSFIGNASGGTLPQRSPSSSSNSLREILDRPTTCIYDNSLEMDTSVSEDTHIQKVLGVLNFRRRPEKISTK